MGNAAHIPSLLNMICWRNRFAFSWSALPYRVSPCTSSNDPRSLDSTRNREVHPEPGRPRTNIYIYQSLSVYFASRIHTISPGLTCPVTSLRIVCWRQHFRRVGPACSLIITHPLWPLLPVEEIQNLSWIRFRQDRTSQCCIGCGYLHVEMAKCQGQLLLYWALFLPARGRVGLLFLDLTTECPCWSFWSLLSRLI